MTLSRTFGPLHQQRVSKGAIALFNNLGIYHFCIAFVVIDFLDVLDLLDTIGLNYVIKYGYTAVVLGFMAVYLLRWRTVDATTAPIIFLVFFVVTGVSFAVRFFIYDERLSYISAFLSPLVFSLAIFIPPNTVMIDVRRIVRVLTFLFSVGSVFYLIEAIIKPFNIVRSLTPLGEVQIHKSLICVLALCLCILSGRKTLGLFVAVVTAIALSLRPVSTLVLALACCLPIAIALRSRVSGPRPVSVLTARVLAFATLLVAISIPLLLYWFFDDVGSIISSSESYLKSDVIGGQSNMEFRLTILKYAYTMIDKTSFLYGSALSGNQTVPLAMLPGWGWWGAVKGISDASIHSDFVVVLVLMGILGYTVFSIAFYLVLKDRFRELGRRDLLGDGVVLQAISIIGVVALIVYCSDQPFLSYYNHAHSVWMLLLISEVARKSRIIDKTEGVGQMIVPAVPRLAGFRR